MRIKLIVFILLINITSYCAAQNLPPELTALAEQCRIYSLKLESVGHIQQKEFCKSLIHGYDVYRAGKYLIYSQITLAKELLIEGIILTNFAIDSNCENTEELKAILRGLELIYKILGKYNT